MTRDGDQPDSKPPPIASSDLAIKIAWLYHVENMTQEAIAGLLNVNRIKVMRSLASSAEKNIVVTTINARSTEQIRLERRIEDRWGLHSAIVVPMPADPQNLERSVGHAVAQFINDNMQDGMTLAIGGGRTLHSSLAFMQQRNLKDASVIGLVGSLPHSKWINPSMVAFSVAEKLGVDSYQITAPVIVDSSGLRDQLWCQPTLQDVLNRAATADMAVLTVGAVTPSATIFKHGIIDPTLIGPLNAQGAVANILCYIIDANGDLVDHEVNNRIMAVQLDTVARLPNVILAASGRAKVAAIRAALKAVHPKVLVTDTETAVRLLKS